MIPIAWLAALTVTEDAAPGCPDARAIEERLGALGVTVRPDDDVRVRFEGAGARRTAQIEIPGAAPRTIAHDGPDCASLAEATVALLSVLLDERPAPPRASEPPPPPSPPPARPIVRLEAGAAASSGVVAAAALGARIGAALRPVRAASIGLAAETWPARDHPVAAGRATVAATSFAVEGCAGAFGGVSLEGCLLGHAGFYRLSAEDFAVVHPATRALFALEADVRAAIRVTKTFGVFARAGLWIPATRIDVGVPGADPAFTSAAIAPKGAIGIEILP